MSQGNSPTASERLTDILSREQQSAAAASSNKATHGSRSNSNKKPQSYKDADDAYDQSATQAEYDGLKSLTTSSNRAPPRKNCCTWKVATVFLLFVAVLLVVIWLMLPAEDIVAKYIPEFAEPANPYLGPEAGIPTNTDESGSSNGGSSTQDHNGEDNNVAIGMPPSQTPGGDTDMDSVSVPSFMQCPDEGNELCCNGSINNCKLRVNEMMFGMVHNAMSTEEGGFFIGYNHNFGLEKALVSGYRGLSLDVCNCNGVLQFCHNVCDLGERIPNEVFTNTVSFLNDYPSEVVVLLFEASQDQGPIVWNDLYNEMDKVDGFMDMVYVHTYGEEWPKMGDLVQQNKRIIVFYFNGGTCTDDTCPTGYNYFFDYAAETQFESASISDLENYEYSCEVTRGPEEGTLPAAFFVVNNFVTPPDPDASKVANSKTFLSDRLTNCANIVGMRPNFVYLDFWSEGVTAQLVQVANAQYAGQLE